MKELNSKEISAVNGGWAVVLAVIAASYVGGYVSGRINKAEREKARQQKLEDYCKTNACGTA